MTTQNRQIRLAKPEVGYRSLKIKMGVPISANFTGK
jgi:hypothetical protein